jgi:hypothetical protein
MYFEEYKLLIAVKAKIKFSVLATRTLLEGAEI